MALTESDTMRGDFAWIPKLMTAILLRACQDLQASAEGRTRKIAQKHTMLDGTKKVYTYAKSASDYEETKAWFLSQEASVFSLIAVCRVIGISPWRILIKMGPYICPALAHLREPYRPADWRGPMRDCKTDGRRKAA